MLHQCMTCVHNFLSCTIACFPLLVACRKVVLHIYQVLSQTRSVTLFLMMMIYMYMNVQVYFQHGKSVRVFRATKSWLISQLNN